MNLKSKLPLAVLTAMVLTACVDDAYDLSDIDTNAELKVNNLVLPLQIDDITLSDIFDLKSNSRISIVDGEYVMMEDGEFTSESISIPEMHADAPEPDHTEKILELIIPDEQVGYHGEYLLKEDHSNFKYEVVNISEHVTSLTKVNAEISVDMTLEIKELDHTDHTRVEYRDLQVQMPKGLEIINCPGMYDPKTGLLFVETLPVTDNVVNLHMDIKSIDLVTAGLSLDSVAHTMIFEDSVSVTGGRIIVETDNIASLPQTVTLIKNCVFSEIDITSFSGSIHYPLEGIDIAPILLNDIPSVLNQEGTDIRVVNPQIYVSINNPLASYSIMAQTGITLSAHRPNAPVQNYTLDNGSFVIGYADGNLQQQFCLSPKLPEHYCSGFENAKHVAYTSLGNVLSGNGLPAYIGVALDNPCIPNQQVNDFKVGVDLGKASGKYKFFCPLALADGSVIVYSERVDGWNDEDVDALVISTLEVSTLITTQLPVGVKLVGYPIDVNGNKINNVSIEGADIPAGAEDLPVTIRITGEVRHLDGICFEAKATSGADKVSLKPSQDVELKNIKVKVSGSYIKEL